MGKGKKPAAGWTLGTQGDVAAALGVSLPTVGTWARSGMPGRPGAYPLPAIVQWLRTDGPWKPRHRPEDSDPLLADGGDSPGLERYRQAKAALAELELEERKRTVITIDKARPILQRFASIIRNMGECLAKQFGNEAALTVNAALDECQHLLDRDLSTIEPADDCPA